jgi:hypothetical protein
MIRLPIKAACPRWRASFAKGKCLQSELYGYFAYMRRVLHNPYMTRKSHKISYPLSCGSRTRWSPPKSGVWLLRAGTRREKEWPGAPSCLPYEMSCLALVRIAAWRGVRRACLRRLSAALTPGQRRRAAVPP